MKDYEIVASEKLFNEWTTLGHKLTNVRAIVQNDQVVTSDDYEMFFIQLQNVSRRIDELYLETMNHIKSGKPL